MSSPGKLRLLSKLSEGSIERFEPTVTDEGRVKYTEVEDLLTRRDGTSREALNTLAERGLLTQEYTTKIYVCPSCQTDGMQYITACSSCDSTNTIRTTFFEHESCDYTGESMEFEGENGTDTYYCPNCEDELDSSEMAITQKHLCKECSKPFERPNHRLWCLDCLHLCAPEKATEQTLYQYELTEDGKNWYEIQTSARTLLADELTTRGFNVHVDTDVHKDENKSYPVHIHAEDDLLNHQIVADIHSTVNSDKLRYISTAAREIRARPLLLTIDDRVPDDILQIANERGVTMLWVDRDDSIRRYESLGDEHRSGVNIIDRLSSAVGLTSREGS